MRKMKKVNGYLVVKFNERELRAWAGTALGNFGVIDAELYTGCLEVDRSVMEYDGAVTLEEAIEQARGLESEMDILDEPIRLSIVRETEECIREDEVNPHGMLEDWKQQLTSQIKSYHYPSVNATTASYALYGFMVALERLGLIDEDECFVTPDTFKPDRQTDFRNRRAPMQQIYALGETLKEECPQNDCMVYRNIFQMCIELDEQIERVSGLARLTLEAELFKRQHELFQMYLHNYAIGEHRTKLSLKKREPPVEGVTPCGECPLQGKAEEMKAVVKLLKEVQGYTNEGSRAHTSQAQEQQQKT